MLVFVVQLFGSWCQTDEIFYDSRSSPPENLPKLEHLLKGKKVFVITKDIRHRTRQPDKPGCLLH